MSLPSTDAGSIKYLFNQLLSGRRGSADRLKIALAELAPGDVPSDADVNSNIARAQSMSPGEYWNAVETGGEWDYKTTRGGRYEDFGNFNFGATCGAVTFSNTACSAGAGWYQLYQNPKAAEGGPFGPTWGDQAKDQFWISRGQRYYRTYQIETSSWTFLLQQKRRKE